MNVQEWLLVYLYRQPAVAGVPAATFKAASRSSRQLPVLFADSGDDADRTVVAGRRRRSDDPGPGGRERAQAPQRQTPDAPSGGGGNDGSGGMPQLPGGGFQLPGGLSPLVIIAIVVILVLVGGGGLLSGNDSQPQETSPQPEIASPVPAVKPATPRPIARATTAPPANNAANGKPGQKWTVILYQDADDKVLEQDILFDFNEAEKIGSTDRVNIVSQIDRWAGGKRGSGDWTTTKRFYLTQDDDLTAIHSRELADLGEVNMSDPKTLIDYVTWAVQNYPADKYVLILSDHGMGWPGGFTDQAPGNGGVKIDRAIPMEGAVGNMLYLNKLDQALADIRTQTGIDKFELVGLDACLMSHLEVLNALQPHARYAVVSQETEPALGWAYANFLGALTQNPDMDGAELARDIVNGYIKDDLRVVDDQARSQWIGRSSPLGGGLSVPSAGQVVSQIGRDITLSAIDLSTIPALDDSVNALALQLEQMPQADVARAREYAQSFTSVFGDNVPPSYIDLGNFVQLLQQSNKNSSFNQAADAVLSSLQKTVLDEMHGPGKGGANGVSIYFPNSQLYQSPVAGAPSYTAIANRFAGETLWDAYLAFHYTGQKFDASSVSQSVPAPQKVTRAPGAGAITLSAIRTSGTVAAPGRPVTLTTKVTGNRIGYIYYFTGFYDQKANSIFVADQDYLESATTRQVGNVYYPDWGTGSFNLQFTWDPLMYAISDGNQSVQAALAPQSYGATYSDTVYTVDGTYTFADDGSTRYARLYFRDGQLRQVFGFTGNDGQGAASEISPKTGDSFTVLETWLDLDASGNVASTVTQPGKTLTFGATVWKWKELDAAQGQYRVGFIAEDLDGNRTAVFTNLTVR